MISVNSGRFESLLLSIQYPVESAHVHYLQPLGAWQFLVDNTWDLEEHIWSVSAPTGSRKYGSTKAAGSLRLVLTNSRGG